MWDSRNFVYRFMYFVHYLKCIFGKTRSRRLTAFNAMPAQNYRYQLPPTCKCNSSNIRSSNNKSIMNIRMAQATFPKMASSPNSSFFSCVFSPALASRTAHSYLRIARGANLGLGSRLGGIVYLKCVWIGRQNTNWFLLNIEFSQIELEIDMQKLDF